MLPCPDPNTLRALVAGRLSGVTLGAVAAHVDRCPDCLARVQQLDPGFDPAVAVRGQPASDDHLGAESIHAGSWATRARHWAWRHQALLAGFAAAVVVGLLMGGLGWWLLERKEAERREEVARLEAQNREAVETALQQASEFLRQGRLAEAEATLGHAAGRLANGGPEDLKERLRRMREDLRLVKQLEEIRLEKAALIDGKLNLHGTRRAYEASFKEHSLDVLAGDEAELARRIAASLNKEQLVAALDDWAGLAADNRTREQLLAVARRADPDPLRNRLRDPAVLRDRQKLTQLAQDADVDRLSPALLVIVASRLEALGGPGLELLQRGQRRYPGDFWLNFALANALQRRKHARWDEAASYYRAALAVRPHNVAVYNNLGLALYAKGNLDEAIAAFRQAIILDPKLALAYSNLGAALSDKGALDGAIASFRHGIALDPKNASTHYHLGKGLYAKGDMDAAIAVYQKAIALDPKLALAHGALGQALLAKGRRAEARAATQQALQLLPPGDPQRRLLTQQLRQCEP
jgi:tetratricopeptide (TPR) repeat protein